MTGDGRAGLWRTLSRIEREIDDLIADMAMETDEVRLHQVATELQARRSELRAAESRIEQD